MIFFSFCLSPPFERAMGKELLAHYNVYRWIRFMVLNVTFNDISVLSWQTALLVEETGASGENHRPAASHWQTLSHNVVLSTPRHERDSNHNFSGDRHLLHGYINNISIMKRYFISIYRFDCTETLLHPNILGSKTLNFVRNIDCIPLQLRLILDRINQKKSYCSCHSFVKWLAISSL